MVHPNQLQALVPTQWQPGRSGNPGGKPQIPQELKAIAAMSRLEVCRIVSKYARMTLGECAEAVCSPDTPILHLCVLALLERARIAGEHAPLAWLLDRALGKIQDVGPAEQQDEFERRRLEALSETELLELARKKIAELEATA